MSPLPDFNLETFFSRWEFAARHHLTASDAQTVSVGELLALGTDADRAEFASLGLGYIPTWGGDALRAAIAGTYERIAPEDVLCFAGAEEAMYLLMRALAGPGDHVVITVPNYQSMETLPLAFGAEVTGVTLRCPPASGLAPYGPFGGASGALPDRGWTLDLDEVRRALRPNTRLVAVNFPNNPTGAVPDRATFEGLVALCAERGVRLLSDEVHRGLELDSARRLPQAADLSPTALSLNVMSKSYGLPGLRVGWLASGDRALLGRLERLKHYTSICNSAPSEFLSTLALRHGETLQGRNRALIAANIPIFQAFFARWLEVFDWAPPQGGCICFPRYLGGDGVEAFCEALVRDAGVLLAPASLFQSALADVPRDRFRLGIGRSNPGPALDAMDAFLADRAGK